MKTCPCASCRPFVERSAIVSLGAAFCLAVLLVSQVAAAAASAPGLLGHWRFEQGRGDVLEDSSGNGNTGDMLGSEWAKGDFGTALHFTGTDSCAAVPQLSGLDGSNELTVEAWVLWEAGGRYPNILTAGQWSPGGFMIFVSGQQLLVPHGPARSGAGEPAPPWQEISAPLVSSFEMREMVPPGGYVQAARDHDVRERTEGGFGQVGLSGRLPGRPGQIGQWGGGQSCHKGLIDEVKIFNRALSAEEVQASYAAESPQRTAPNQAAYKIVVAVPQTAATIENQLAKLELDVRGRGVALIEKTHGPEPAREDCAPGHGSSAGSYPPPHGMLVADGQLRLQFGKDEAKAVIGCTSKDKYLTFTVLAVEGEGVESLSFLSLTVQPGKHASDTSGAVTDDDWGVCLRELNLQTQVSVGGGPPTLRANCTAEYGLVGSQAGLVVATADQLRPALQEMVQAEGLPQSSLGGPWALDAEGIRGSYLFAHPSERDAERWIDLAKRGGFTHLHYDGWYKSLGHYEPNPSLFPNGLEGMKTMVRKVHAAGLKAGMHTLTGCIQPNDPWVTPVPDKRLAADASYTLAADMDEKSDTILTVEKPRAARCDLELFRQRQRDSDRRRDHPVRGDLVLAAVRVPEVYPRRFQDQTRRASEGRRGRSPPPGLHRLLSRRAFDAGGRSRRRDCPRLQRVRVRPDLHGRLRRHGQPARDPDHAERDLPATQAARPWSRPVAGIIGAGTTIRGSAPGIIPSGA